MMVNRMIDWVWNGYEHPLALEAFARESPTGEAGAPNLPTLAHVLLAIADAEKRAARATLQFYAANGNRRKEERWGDIGAAIDVELSELRDRARAMIEAATGVPWEQIYGALA